MMTKSSIDPQGRKVVTSGSGISRFRPAAAAPATVTFSFASPVHAEEKEDGKKEED